MTTNQDDHDAPGRQRRRWASRLSAWLVVVAGVALGLALLKMPGVGFLLLSILIGLGVTLAILLTGMMLGWLGFGLFALLDRLLVWSCREPEWFQPTPTPPKKSKSNDF